MNHKNILAKCLLGLLLLLPHLGHGMEPQSDLTKNQDIITVDQDLDMVSMFFVAGTFHMYANYLAGDENYLNVNKDTRSRQNLLLDYDYPSTKYFEGWELKPIEGYLGTYNAYLDSQGEHNDPFGVVGYKEEDNLIAIAFRGSKRFEEYLHNNFNWTVKLPASQKNQFNFLTTFLRDNLNAWHYLDFPGNLHGGYYNRIATSQDSIRANLDCFIEKAKTKYPHDKPRLLIAGFSLGAGSAGVAAGFIASDLKEENNKLAGLKDAFSSIDLRVFGSPKISGHHKGENNETYGTWLEKKGVTIKSYVCGTDIVASIPPFQMLEWTLHFDNGVKFHLPFEEFYPPIKLSAMGVEKWHTASLYCHEVRLYMASLLKCKGLPPESLPLFTISKFDGTLLDSKSLLNIVLPPKRNEEVDALDKIAIDHTLLAFHAYDHHCKTSLWNPEDIKPGKTKEWIPIPKHITDGWFFYDILGETGLETHLYPSLVGILGYNSSLNMMTVAYRGSQQFSDWANNFNLGRCSPTEVKTKFDLHAGYVANFEHSKESLTCNIEKALQDTPDKLKETVEVTFTGHSLGGATATVAAYYFADQGLFKNIHLRIFAPPPVGSTDFNDWMEQNLKSAKVFTREVDMLPEWFIPSYVIYGSPLYLTGKHIILPSHDDSFVNHAMAHDNRKYRRGVYEALGLEKEYEKLYTIHVMSPLGTTSEW